MNYRKMISKTLIGALITGIALFPSNTATAAGYSQPKTAPYIFSESASSSFESKINNLNLIDEAYENMMAKENYIVELISRHSGQNTSFDKWKYNLSYLQKNYDEIMSIDNINKFYVDSYIEDYEIVTQTQNMPLSRDNSGQNNLSSYSTYSANAAVTYATNYAMNYNSAYPDWNSYGGDCANFVSQCLYAGGKSMKGTPGTSAEADNWSNWFSRGNTCNVRNVSSTWRGANAFRNFWQSNSNGYRTFSSTGSSAFNYAKVGDAISLLNSNGSAYHTLIIIKKHSASNDFTVAAHTSNTKTKKLSEYSLSGGFIIYKM
ncbi:MAG: hypothetical protein HFH32_06385 [Eubacterium sp.]|jgi:hypothetical protein|nr:hypothetical protein [Eubacterium sp.]